MTAYCPPTNDFLSILISAVAPVEPPNLEVLAHLSAKNVSAVAACKEPTPIPLCQTSNPPLTQILLTELDDGEDGTYPPLPGVGPLPPPATIAAV